MLNYEEKKTLELKWFSSTNSFNFPPQKPSPLKLACIYAFEMGDSTVKIGVTQDADRRKLSIRQVKCQDVLRVHSTSLAPRDFMTKLELRCHRAFSERRGRGEYFNITFEEACAELDSHAAEIAAALHAADRRYLDEVTFFFNEFLPEYKKAKVAYTDELKAQIAQLKQENQALKAARPNFKPQPMSPEQNIASLEKLLKSIIGDHVKFEHLGEVKDGKLQ